MPTTEDDYPDTAPPWLPCEQLDQMRDAFAGAIADLTVMGIEPYHRTVTGYVAMRTECDRVHAARREYLRATRFGFLRSIGATQTDAGAGEAGDSGDFPAPDAPVASASDAAVVTA